MTQVLDYLCLAIALGAAAVVVLLPAVDGPAVALAALGTALTTLFILLRASDVANPEVVLGAVALPVLYLAAIGKARAALRPETDRAPGTEEPLPDPADDWGPDGRVDGRAR